MAGEQSTGTFVRVAGETDELREAHAARVESMQELDSAEAPSLPGAGKPIGATTWRRAEVELSWPLSNMGTSLPNVVATMLKFASNPHGDPDFCTPAPLLAKLAAEGRSFNP